MADGFQDSGPVLQKYKRGVQDAPFFGSRKGPSSEAASYGLTVRVKVCESFGVTPLLAVIVRVVVPAGVAVVLAIVAVPSVLSVKVTPVGNCVGVSVRVAIGNPVVVTLNVPAVPVVNVVSVSRW